MAIMQKGAHRTQKFERWGESLTYRLRKKRFLRRPGVLLIDGGEQREPTPYVVVAQSSRSFFDVGFQMKNCVAVFSVAGTCDFCELLDDVVPFPQKEFWQNFVMQAREDLAISSYKAAIEKRD